MPEGRQFNLVFGKPDPKDPKRRVWIPVGKGFENPDGSIRVLMDAIPINFTGELHLFPAK